MAIADFTITATGLRPVERKLYRLLQRFGDLFPLMDRIGMLLENSTRHRFETSRAPSGATWKPSLRARFEAVPQNDKTVGPLNSKTLVRDGHLRDSITHAATSSTVEVGSNLLYARIHQLGGKIVPVNAPALSFRLPGGAELIHVMSVIIPARPYLGVSAEDMVGIKRQVERFAEAAA